MRKLVILSLAAATLAGAAGAAYAEPAAAPERAPLTRAAVEARSAEAFARMDANDDGVLDQADRAERQRAMFARIDADNNGTISFEEFSAVREQHQGRGAERRGPGAREMGRAADSNGDGTVTRAEFTSAALARFDGADADNDGTLGPEERPARHMMHRDPRDAG
jgi:hypothetical protein